MEAAAGKRELSGEKAQRIVDAMRESVGARGIAGATFERVAGEAGVSRGLLHYYFGTKERLLVEVVRSDTERRMQLLDEPLARASTVDEVLDVLVGDLIDAIEHDPRLFALLYEVFTAGRRNPEIQREVADLFVRTRGQLEEVLARKNDEGVLTLRMGVEGTAGLLIAVADGIALQVISDPGRDHSSTIAAGREAARHILVG